MLPCSMHALSNDLRHYWTTFGYSIILLIPPELSLTNLEYHPQLAGRVWSGTAERCIVSFHTQLNRKHNADHLVFAVSQHLRSSLAGDLWDTVSPKRGAPLYTFTRFR